MLVKLIVFCSIIAVVSTAEAACESCKDAVPNLLQSAVAGVDTLELADVEVCKILTVTGLKTIKAYGTPCIKSTNKTEFRQEIGVEFDEFYINCTLTSLNGLLKALGLPALPEIPISMPKMPSWGGSKKKEEPTTPAPAPKSAGILANWNGLKLQLSMKLDFKDDAIEVLSSTVAESNLDALKVECEGDGLIMTACGAITKPEIIQSILGLIAQYAVKHVIGIVLKNDSSTKEIMTMLNCGDPDPPDY